MQLSLILPVHNQGKIIKPVYKKIKRELDNLEIKYECILVENGSEDNTWREVKKIAQDFSNTKILQAPKGYGSAVLAGSTKAQGKYVCYMPSDGQVDMKIFQSVWQIAQSGRWDIVKVKRVTREGLTRKLISLIFSTTIRILFDVDIIDINGSPRILLREKLRQLNLKSKDSFIDVEFAVKARNLGWRIKEIPMQTLPRTGGKSTRSWRTYVEFFKNIVYYRLFGF